MERDVDKNAPAAKTSGYEDDGSDTKVFRSNTESAKVNEDEWKSNHLTAASRMRRQRKELRERGTEGDRRGRRRRRNHRADSACLCFHFPPQDRQSRGKEMEERDRNGKYLSFKRRKTLMCLGKCKRLL